MTAATPYLLFTPGPLSTTPTVREAMMRELSTWDSDYHEICQSIRRRLVDLAVADPAARSSYTAILMQGSGTFVIESVIGSVIPRDGGILVASNGAYGKRMTTIARRLGLATIELPHREDEQVDPGRLRDALADAPEITHVAYVHLETTTGIINDAHAIGEVIAEAGKRSIVDAMSSFGGIPFDMADFRIDYAVSSANKCIQGVPGFGYVVANREALATTAGWARSVSLDLHDQWAVSEASDGKLRFTSPTHAMLGFDRALDELIAEGGVAGRHRRYRSNQQTLVTGMAELGFRTLLPSELQSPVITTFRTPDHPSFSFEEFYLALKARGFMIYPGKVTDADTFRIGTIGDLHPDDVDRLLEAIDEVRAEMGFSP
jgi:2-aminoethylphosphonate-pyruvate transaminase